jgi:hypothetical protein
MAVQSAPSPGWALYYIPPPAEWDDWWKSKGGVIPAVVSAAGTTQGTATPLTTHTAVVTGGAANAGLIATLPFHEVWNRGPNAYNLYPASGANFEGLAANAPKQIPVGIVARMVMASGTQGYVSSSALDILAQLVASGSNYANDAAAAAGGVAVGQPYLNGSIVMVRRT